MNGHDARVKVEDKMDEGQIDRLTAGVPTDASGPAVRMDINNVGTRRLTLFLATGKNGEALSNRIAKGCHQNYRCG